MRTLAIESNGRLENTAMYFNGEMIRGVRDLMLNLDETGAFETVVQYKDASGKIHSHQLFVEHLEGLQTVSNDDLPEKGMELRQLVIESTGNIEETTVFINEEPQDGIVSLFLKLHKDGTDEEFSAQVTYRNADGSTATEDIF
jgi:hypothetical protein